MSVLVHRVYLYDSDNHASTEQQQEDESLACPRPQVAPYSYVDPSSSSYSSSTKGTVAVCRVPNIPVAENRIAPVPVDRSIPNPFSPDVDKYWSQRHRLFSKFDAGIQLDEEGIFSVTPEQIADHVAKRVSELSKGKPMVLVDAFGGCGGNSISFAKMPNITVIATDVDRTKLRKAAHNAAIYGIPPSKLVFIECNVLFILEHCYKNGVFMLDKPLSNPEDAMALMNAMPPPVETECASGYQLGGIDLLPPSIDAVFMDPPWGGVDYNLFGKNGYDLQLNMRIARPTSAVPVPQGSLNNDFFDDFVAQPRNQAERKAQFNLGLDESNCVDGAELLRLAAAATKTHFVIYDLPKNTNRGSLGRTALAAGYRGNCKLEEHYLNGRLKTITAYLGCDWRYLLSSEDVS